MATRMANALSIKKNDSISEKLDSKRPSKAETE